VGVTGVRRILDNAADRALAASRVDWFDEIGPAYWETPPLIDPTPYEEFSEEDAIRASLAIDGILAAHRQSSGGCRD